MEALKKFWHWLQMEDENGKPLDDKKWISGVNDFRIHHARNITSL